MVCQLQGRRPPQSCDAGHVPAGRACRQEVSTAPPPPRHACQRVGPGLAPPAACLRNIRVRQDVLVHALRIVDGEDRPVQQLQLLNVLVRLCRCTRQGVPGGVRRWQAAACSSRQGGCGNVRCPVQCAERPAALKQDGRAASELTTAPKERCSRGRAASPAGAAGASAAILWLVHRISVLRAVTNENVQQLPAQGSPAQIGNEDLCLFATRRSQGPRWAAVVSSGLECIARSEPGGRNWPPSAQQDTAWGGELGTGHVSTSSAACMNICCIDLRSSVKHHSETRSYISRSGHGGGGDNRPAGPAYTGTRVCWRSTNCYPGHWCACLPCTAALFSRSCRRRSRVCDLCYLARGRM